MSRSLLRLCAIACAFGLASSFSPSAQSMRPSTKPLRSNRNLHKPSLVILHNIDGSKDDEIAKLEEQLAKLKADKETADVPQMTESTPEILEEIEMEAMFSERWKEQEQSLSETDSDAAESKGPGLTGIIGAIALAVVLAFFSQVPVGQENLSRFSVINKGPDTTINLGDLNEARKGDI